MEDSVDLDEVARKCPDTFTGADLKHLVDKTSEFCLDMDQVYFEGKADIKPVKMEHFEQSLKEIIEYNSKKSKVSFSVLIFILKWVDLYLLQIKFNI